MPRSTRTDHRVARSGRLEQSRLPAKVRRQAHRSIYGSEVSAAARDALLHTWSRDARYLHHVDSAAFLDDVLDRARGRSGSGSSDPAAQAIAAGVDVTSIAGHYASLRDAALVVSSRSLSRARFETLKAIGRAIDDAVATAIESYTHAQRETATKAAGELRCLAEEALRARDQLIAIVAHDLRNPLAAITLLARHLQKHHADGAETCERLDLIKQAADRMQHSIAELLDMARLEAGRFSLEPKPTSAAMLVHQAVESHAAQATDQGIELCGETGTHAWVLADPARIAQVLDNLVDNAIKFGRRGDVVTIGVVPEDGRARFCVSDTGPGIAPEHLPHTFEMFWTAMTEPRTGAGLGLYVSKRIVEAHGATIQVVSEPGAGTTLSFTLPVVDQDTR